MKNQKSEISLGISNAFLDSSVKSNLAYSPQLLTNDFRNGTKVLTYIENELLHCEEFSISVAFISRSGFAELSEVLKELSNRGIHGRILTTDYLTFSDPFALDRLSALDNIELKLYHVNDSSVGFHTKGYLFRKEGTYRIIIGSSNMTQTALTTNMEWNAAFVSMEQGSMAQTIVNEFEMLWKDEAARDYDEIREFYKKQYDRKKQIDKLIKEQHKVALEDDIVDFEAYTLKPNRMQEAFVGNIHDLRQNGAKRALLISATGTGKTYASAFALKRENPKKALFIVHRELIARQAMKSYYRVFGKHKKMALLSGNSKEYDADILFATMNMMAKIETLEYLEKNNIHYDWVCIDEVHRAGAQSYQKIMNVLRPDFWLGMTASPERMDGFDIFDLFDHNIAYEIRLQQALQEDMLCPFHYFGITDFQDRDDVDGTEARLRNFKYLVSEKRVDYILEQANYHGYSGDRVKGLVFCSGKEEATELARLFVERGYFARALFGDANEKSREECIELLAKDVDKNLLQKHLKCIDNQEPANPEKMPFLDYIFTIDIFNEGVDIPEINQVLMLRETKSPIIFVQQLGRGLRKADDKEFVVIIDFIGNYTNNYMIPIALSGDRSYNKDAMRRAVLEGTRVIPGASSIHFDEISKQRIFKSIDSARTNDIRLLKNSYEQLKYRLGRIPTLMDFKEYGSIDVSKFFDKCGSYYAFLVKYYSKEYTTRLSNEEAQVIEFLSKKVTKMKRIHELVLLKHLINHNRRVQVYFSAILPDQYKRISDGRVEESVYRNLTNQFAKDEEKKKYRSCVLVKRTGEKFELDSRFQTMLFTNVEFYNMVNEILEYGIKAYKDAEYSNYKNTNFSLYQKYTYEDVCRLLNWKKNMNAQNIGGYFYDEATKTLPVFINYDKTEDAIAYEDRFETPDNLIALSKHPRKINSSDADHFYKRTIKDKENQILLFVRKNKDDKEAKEFYFLGEVFAQGEPNPIKMPKTGDDAFEINYKLDVPVREDIYDYIKSEAVE